ncbi:MAG: acyltransferase family protein [Aquihabitans sp.]
MSLLAPPVDAAREVRQQPVALTGYRPHLDGMRALAVYLVVAFHAGVSRLNGGFIGVDVFFVLSGYLVTQVLLRDVASHGRIRFVRFYGRRVRRLLPASVVVILATLVVYGWMASPIELQSASHAARAALLYVANWFYIREATDYFAGGASPSPLLHFWSLAVEEQFYLVWPVILATLIGVSVRFRERRWMALRIAIVLLAGASLAWAWYQSTVAPSRAYYGTDTRAYQLLAGAFLAVTPSLVTRARRLDLWAPAAAAGASVGLVVLSSWLVPGRPVARGIGACVLTMVLIIGLERGGGLVQSVFSSRPMVELGRISYGTYLWHWPVIVIAERVIDLTPVQMAILAAGVASGLASLSSQIVEHGPRRSPRLDRMPRVVVASGLSISMLAGLVVVPALADHPGPQARSTTAAGSSSLLLTPVPATFDAEAVHAESFTKALPCLKKQGLLCTVTMGAGPRILLLGDSNAMMLHEPLARVAKKEGMTLILGDIYACAWPRNFHYDISDAKDIARCEAHREQAYDALSSLDIDLVVGMNVQGGGSLGNPESSATPSEKSLRSTTAASAKAITAAGSRLLVIEPLPRAPNRLNPLDCLATASSQEACRFRVDPRPYWVISQLHEIAAANPAVSTLDLSRVVCPDYPICAPIVDGLPVRWDQAHLTTRFSSTLDDELGGAIKRLNLRPGR